VRWIAVRWIAVRWIAVRWIAVDWTAAAAVKFRHINFAEYFSLWNFSIQRFTLFFMQPSKLDQILGLEIQRRRIEKGWSQEYLAEVTGLHRTYISQLERGLKSPSVRVLSHITNALGITMGEFLRVVEEILGANGK